MWRGRGSQFEFPKWNDQSTQHRTVVNKERKGAHKPHNSQLSPLPPSLPHPVPSQDGVCPAKCTCCEQMVVSGAAANFFFFFSGYCRTGQLINDGVYTTIRTAHTHTLGWLIWPMDVAGE